MRNKLNKKAFTVFIAFLLLLFTQTATASQDRVTSKMTALDGITLKSKNYTVTLWGIKPVEKGVTPSQLKALDLLDNLIGQKEVNCKIIQGYLPSVVARCIGYTDIDLGLELINHGLAVVDRQQMDNSEFSEIYLSAQELSRKNGKGIWQEVKKSSNNDLIPKIFKTYFSPRVNPWLIWLGGPLIGFIIAIIIMRQRLNKILSLQQDETETLRQKEFKLHIREKNILISLLKGELTENKNKVEAFLAVYRDLLQQLTSKECEPEYKKTGEVIQKRPALSKSIFESNIGKLSLLDMNVAGQISSTYSNLPKEHQYTNLEKDLPIEKAIDTIQDILKSAEGLLPAIDNSLKLLDTEVKKTAEEVTAGLKT